ncbi:hypothetical protein AB3H85_00905 [Enterococcus sp. C78]|jgi:hypothetical protein|uniref:hypothetical protein n=1 Tax=Enterococcus sp. C78 TaxID=3231336 RepID=UPI0034A01D1A
MNKNYPKKYRNTYVLTLANSDYRYYIGHTTKSKEAIFKERINGGRVLTRDCKLLEIIEWIPNGLITEQEGHAISYLKIIKYMEVFGLTEVRGGTFFCEVDTKKHIDRVILSSNNDKRGLYNSIKQQLEKYSQYQDFKKRNFDSN